MLSRRLQGSSDPPTGVCCPCQSSRGSLWSRWAHREGGFVPLWGLERWGRWRLGRQEGSRRCEAAGGKVSEEAGGGYEEYQFLRPS